MSNALIQEVVEHLEALPPNLQEQVLVFVRNLDSSLPQGIAGQSLVQFANTIPESDLEVMLQTIEQGCEQVDPNEW